MNDAKKRGQALPFSETDHVEIRHLARMVLDFADEVVLMADGRRSTLELKISDELKNLAKRGVQARALPAIWGRSGAAFCILQWIKWTFWIYYA